MRRAQASAAKEDGPAATSSTSWPRRAATSRSKHSAYSASDRPKNGGGDSVWTADVGGGARMFMDGAVEFRVENKKPDSVESGLAAVFGLGPYALCVQRI